MIIDNSKIVPMAHNPCKRCGLSVELEILAYTFNGKKVYSQFCKACTKAHWMEFKKNHPELWDALRAKQEPQEATIPRS